MEKPKDISDGAFLQALFTLALVQPAQKRETKTPDVLGPDEADAIVRTALSQNPRRQYYCHVHDRALQVTFRKKYSENGEESTEVNTGLYQKINGDVSMARVVRLAREFQQQMDASTGDTSVEEEVAA